MHTYFQLAQLIGSGDMFCDRETLARLSYLITGINIGYIDCMKKNILFIIITQGDFSRHSSFLIKHVIQI